MEPELTCSDCLRILGDAGWMINSCQNELALLESVRSRRHSMSDELFADLCATLLREYLPNLFERMNRVENYLIHVQAYLIDCHVSELVTENPREGNTGVELTEVDLSELVQKCEESADELPF